MNKRIISFFLALTMIMGLMSGFSLSVNANDPSIEAGNFNVSVSYDRANYRVNYQVSELAPTVSLVIVGVEQRTPTFMQYPVRIHEGSGNITGSISVGDLLPSNGYVLVVIADGVTKEEAIPLELTYDLDITATFPNGTTVTRGSTVPVTFVINRQPNDQLPAYPGALRITATGAGWTMAPINVAAGVSTASGNITVPDVVSSPTTTPPTASVTFRVVAPQPWPISPPTKDVGEGTHTISNITVINAAPTITSMTASRVNLGAGTVGQTVSGTAEFAISGTGLNLLSHTNFSFLGFGGWNPALDNSGPWVSAGAQSSFTYTVATDGRSATLRIPVTASAISTTLGQTRDVVMTINAKYTPAMGEAIDRNATVEIRQSRSRITGGTAEEEEDTFGSFITGRIPPRDPATPPIIVGPGNPGDTGPLNPVVTPAHLLFDDVRLSDWFHDAVGIVAAYGLFHGTAPRIFEPQTPMSRAMFAQVLANLTGAKTEAFAALEPVFSDVQPGSWYYGAVQWGYHAGIISGVGEGRFAPHDDVTREQMASLLNRYVKANGIALPSNEARTFTDAAQISWWAADDVATIQRAGIIGGYPEGDFRPQRSSTRAEVASVFAQFLKVTGIHAEIAQEMFR